MKPGLGEIVATVIDILREMTQEWDLDPSTLGPQTRLSADLGLSSIDALHLMASIDTRLGCRLSYERLILKDGKYVGELLVGELASFVHDNFDQPRPGPQAM
jgi:acyl carrier protein